MMCFEPFKRSYYRIQLFGEFMRVDFLACIQSGRTFAVAGYPGYKIESDKLNDALFNTGFCVRGLIIKYEIIGQGAVQQHFGNLHSSPKAVAVWA